MRTTIRGLFIVEGPEHRSGLRITGDPGTLQALNEILDMASRAHSDEDLAEWADQASIAITQAMRRGGDGNVTLPAYSPTPGLDSFNDDEGPGPADDEEF